MGTRVRHWRILVLIGLAVFFSAGQVLAADKYEEARQAMVRAIEKDTLETSLYLHKTELAPLVMKAMGTVLRHEFVPKSRQAVAYENRPLAIGYSQTISQPYIVALMTDLLMVDKDDRVLEVGTGSGYQAAILSGLVDRVFSIEIIEPLGKRAEKKLAELDYSNVKVRIGDGYYGWPEEEPFDAIVVTAAASHVPPPLISQLKPGGRMVIPVGSRFMVQQLLLVLKDEEGKTRTRQILPVRFVPLTGEH